jgi:hypothetical protein
MAASRTETIVAAVDMGQYKHMFKLDVHT